MLAFWVSFGFIDLRWAFLIERPFGNSETFNFCTEPKWRLRFDSLQEVNDVSHNKQDCFPRRSALESHALSSSRMSNSLLLLYVFFYDFPFSSWVNSLINSEVKLKRKHIIRVPFGTWVMSREYSKRNCWKASMSICTRSFRAHVTTQLQAIRDSLAQQKFAVLRIGRANNSARVFFYLRARSAD